MGLLNFLVTYFCVIILEVGPWNSFDNKTWAYSNKSLRTSFFFSIFILAEKNTYTPTHVFFLCVCSVHTTGRLTNGQGRRRHLCGKQLAFLPSVERRRQSKEGAQPHGHEQGAEDRHHGSQSQAPLGLHHVDLTCTEDRRRSED